MLKTISPERRNLIFLWAAFAFLYAWESVMFFTFRSSPLAALPLPESGINTSRLVFYIAQGAAMLCCVFLLKDKTNRAFDIAAACVFAVAAVLVFFTKRIEYLHITLACLGLAAGAVMYRLLYKLFFFVSLKTWPIFIASAHIIIKLFDYTFSLTPNYWLKLSLSLVALIAGLVCYNFFKGDILKRRAALPDSKIDLRIIFYYGFLAVGMGLCNAILRDYIFPVLTGANDRYYKILVMAAAITAIALLYKYCKRVSYYMISIVMLTAALILFKTFGVTRAIAVESLVEVSRMLFEVFLFSLCGAAFFRYGNKFYRLRGFISMLIFVMVAPIIISEFLPQDANVLPWLFPVVLVMFTVLFALRIKMEKYETDIIETSAALNAAFETQPDIETVLAIAAIADVEAEEKAEFNLDDALASLNCDTLTEREKNILSLVLAKKGIDIIAYLSGVSESTVRTHISNVCQKLDVNSKKELIALFGAAHTSKLTRREEEILALVLGGETNEDIAKKLFLSPYTVKTHITNICYKMSVKNRAELISAKNTQKD